MGRLGAPRMQVVPLLCPAVAPMRIIAFVTDVGSIPRILASSRPESVNEALHEHEPGHHLRPGAGVLTVTPDTGGTGTGPFS